MASIATASKETTISPTKNLFEKPVLVVAIAGGTGSGKTSVPNAIRKAIGDDYISVITHDSYYKDLSHLTLQQRTANNFDHPNSLDTELMIEECVHNLSVLYNLIALCQLN